jgi:hypothetical protein
MDKRKTATDGEAVAQPDHASGQPQLNIELPAVESPSISPADMIGTTSSAAEAPLIETTEAFNASTETTAMGMTESASIGHIAAARRPRFILRPRHKRYTVLAASMAIAAALGAIIGTAASGGFSTSPAIDVAAVEENKAMQQSVARLTKEITSLKSSLEAANKSASSQIAKISERLSRETANITASISTQQQATPASAPLPPPRPEAASVDSAPRMAILTDWSIRETRDGYVYVQGHGDVYQVVRGAPLPGLGPVEQIKRQDGRWLVVTPKGIIVSMRDRRYFEQF